DTGPIMLAVRRDQAGRLILGSMGKVIGGERGLSVRWANKTVRKHFPFLGDVKWQKSWHGRIAMTADHLPRIHQPAPNLYTPIAYNGRGIAPGTAFGRAIAEIIGGGPEEDLPVPVTAVRPERFGAARTLAAEVAFKVYRVFKSL
ncbi:MAG: FAD-dependent oxidoreductase, partial [Gammaproteobacteria bacterium]|nr:FAD-dependent oxidoreductase [Gammaproteobacteria bacterium]